MTVTGTVSAGVESGCLVFEPKSAPGKGTWVLVGRTGGLEAGMTVTIRGALAPGVMTTCQQGTPFRVEAVVSR